MSFVSGLQIVDSISKSLKIYCDNSTAVFLTKNNKSRSRSWHIDVKYLKLQEWNQTRWLLIILVLDWWLWILWRKDCHLRLIRSMLSIWDSVLFCNWHTFHVFVAFGRYENSNWFKFIFSFTVCIHKVERMTICMFEY